MDNKTLLKKEEISSVLSMQVLLLNDYYAWISHYKFNCLIQVDAINNVIVKTEPFLNEAIDGFALHRGVVQYQNKLIFYPNRGKGLNIVDMDTGQQSYVDLSEFTIAEERCKFLHAFVQDKVLWLIPQDYNQEMLSVELDSYEVKKHDWWKASLQQCQVEVDSVFLGVTEVDRMSLISTRAGNYFLKFSVRDKSMRKVTLSTEEIKIHRIFSIGDFIWCTCYDAPDIYICTCEGVVVKRIVIDEGMCEISPFVSIVKYKEMVILIPRCGESVWFLDCNGGILRRVCLNYYMKIRNTNKDSYNWTVRIEGNELVLYPNYDGVVRKIDLETFAVTELRYEGLKMLYEYYVMHILSLIVAQKRKVEGFVKENEIALNDFILLLNG